MPKVTIIMPTFNRAWIIERAIRSVLAQTFNDFELLVVDDGSTDDTQEKLQKIQAQDPRIKIIKLETNQGAPAARNAAIAQAQGEIIAYLDSDNVWYPTNLEVMLEELTPTYMIVYSGQNIPSYMKG